MVADAGEAAWFGDVENGFNRTPGRCDRYESRVYVASSMIERKTRGTLVAIS